ncbi:MAG: segregation/condensation protein A [Clostridia bacterium]|nr:segregation/condensation protein A [Clostridia bacterium]
MPEILINQKPKYKFVIDNFEGPLDLLLFLITKNKMNIFDISLNDLTDEYVKYLEEMNESNIEVASEFIVMAATLLDIKARKLLPEIEPKDEEEETVSEEDIINKIIAYKKYKEVAEIINDMYSQNFGSFAKPFEKIKFNTKLEYTGDHFSAQDIFEIYTRILYRNANKINKKAEELNRLAVYERITVQDKVKQIVNYLNCNHNMVFNSVFNSDICDNIEVVTAFLGVLELSKLKQVDIEQQYLFSDINVTKKDEVNIKIDLTNIME